MRMLFAASAALFMACCVIPAQSATAQNRRCDSPEAQKKIAAAAEKFRQELIESNPSIATTQNHDPAGHYLNYASGKKWKETPQPIPLKLGGLKFDEDGMPLIKRRGIEGFFFNPVTQSQFTLSAFSRFRSGDISDDLFLRGAARLLENQSEDGAFRYHFHFRHYTLKAPYEDGWISGMAQGQALSVFARAYLLTNDEKYRTAGDKALDFLLTSEEEGGPATTLADLDPALSDDIFLEEYVTEPDVYTLNGYIFTLLGLYDWWKDTDSEKAKAAFQSGVQSLEKVLPLYEVGNFTAYDLSYLTVRGRDCVPHMSKSYHAIHIQLLYALYSITGIDQFKDTATRWRGFVGDTQ